jgi:small-conductance mechanosensitive channel
MDLPDRTVQALVTAAIGLGAVIAVRFAALRLLRTYEQRLAQRDPLEVARRRTIARVLVRMTVALVALIAIWSLLATFPETDRLAQAFLASGAVVAILVGLAVSTPLGNVGAGVMLAFTQPVRLGDRITVGEHTGVVDEITLSYTALVTDDERHVYIPNRDMVSNVIVNRSVGDPRRIVTVELPVAIGVSLAEARRIALESSSRAEGAQDLSISVRIGNVSEKVVWLNVVAYAPPRADVALIASSIREEALAALNQAELLPGGP